MNRRIPGGFPISSDVCIAICQRWRWPSPPIMRTVSAKRGRSHTRPIRVFPVRPSHDCNVDATIDRTVSFVSFGPDCCQYCDPRWESNGASTANTHESAWFLLILADSRVAAIVVAWRARPWATTSHKYDVMHLISRRNSSLFNSIRLYS